MTQKCERSLTIIGRSDSPRGGSINVIIEHRVHCTPLIPSKPLISFNTLRVIIVIVETRVDSGGFLGYWGTVVVCFNHRIYIFGDPLEATASPTEPLRPRKAL